MGQRGTRFGQGGLGRKENGKRKDNWRDEQIPTRIQRKEKFDNRMQLPEVKWRKRREESAGLKTERGGG